MFLMFCFCKQKTAYELRISDWSSDVCSSDLPDAADQAFITRRIIDCCLREDIRGIVSTGQICRLPEELSQHLQHQPDASWLRIAHLGADELWLPVVKAYPLQDWIGTGDAWIKVSPQSHGEVQHGYGLWMGHLRHGLDEESLTLFAAYRTEADYSTEHRTHRKHVMEGKRG